MSAPLDLRHLPAPEPMERIIEALDTLPAGGVLIALTPFRPTPLLPMLEAWGFVANVEDTPEGQARIRICRREDAALLEADA